MQTSVVDVASHNMQASLRVIVFFKEEDGIRYLYVTGVQTCVFFFSSRRRHTRSLRDWSSDVCSSDLMIRHTRSLRDWSSDVCSSDLELQSRRDLVCRLLLDWSSRSEERRVGKEC